MLDFFHIRVGRVVKYFTIADLALWAGWGFVDPVFSVFIIREIEGATLLTVGISGAIYWVLRSLLQIPIAKKLDAVPGEEDDFRALIVGLLVLSASSFCYILVAKVWQLYAIQVLRALGFALYVPSWNSIFSRHLDRDSVSIDWSIDNTAVGLAVGVSAFLAGTIATYWGFTALFVFCAVLSMVAALILLRAPTLIFPPRAGALSGLEGTLKDK